MKDKDSFLREIRKIEKEYGDNSVFTLGEDVVVDVDVIPTGSLALDVALGVGGIPRGRLTELYGPDGAGKTTLAYHVVAEAQKLGLDVLFVDMENSVDINYAKNIGVDVENVYWSQPQYLEEALGVIEAAISTNSFQLIVLDSVASLAPMKEQEDELQDANVALTPRFLARFFRRQAHNVRDNNTALLFTNQLRDRIGAWVSGYTTPGGHALKHFRSVALYIRRATDIKASGEIVGHTAKVNVKKNKLAPPFREAELDIIYGEGIDPYRDLLEVAKNLGVVILKGSYYTYDGDNIGQGKDNASEALKNDEELFNKIREECLNG